MHYPREVLLVVGLTAGGTAAFYTYTTYMQKFLKLSVGLTDDQTTSVTLAARSSSACVLQPIYGAISDRIGRKWLLIAFGVTGVLFTIPILTTLQAVKGRLPAFLLIAAAWMIVSGYTSINAVVKAELFPTQVRAHRRRPALRADSVHFRRDGRLPRAMVQIRSATRAGSTTT